MALDLDRIAANAANAAIKAYQSSVAGTNAFNLVKSAIVTSLAAENEICAQLCDTGSQTSPSASPIMSTTATAIRARVV